MYLLPRVPAWLSGTVHLPVQERQVRSLGREDPLEEGVATHSGILAGKVPWTGAWQAVVHGVTKNWAQLNTHACTQERMVLILFSKSSLGAWKRPNKI